jgi:hypothetical protein
MEELESVEAPSGISEEDYSLGTPLKIKDAPNQETDQNISDSLLEPQDKKIPLLLDTEDKLFESSDAVDYSENTLIRLI